MNYLTQINAFWDMVEIREKLSPTAIAIYFALLNINNRRGWKTTIKVHPSDVMEMVLIGNVKTFYEHFHRLLDAGFIEAELGKNQFKPTQLTIKKLSQPSKKTVRQGINKEKPPCSASSRQSLQDADNQTTYNEAKQVNSKNLETVKENHFSLNEIELGFWNRYEHLILSRTKIAPTKEKENIEHLRNIIGRLSTGNKREPLEVWGELMAGWNKLIPYFQSKITLNQIEKNLTQLLDQLYSNHENNQSNYKNNSRQDRSKVERKNFKF